MAFDWNEPLSRRELFWGRFMAITGLLLGVLVGIWIGFVVWGTGV